MRTREVRRDAGALVQLGQELIDETTRETVLVERRPLLLEQLLALHRFGCKKEDDLAYYFYCNVLTLHSL